MREIHLYFRGEAHPSSKGQKQASVWSFGQTRKKCGNHPLYKVDTKSNMMSRKMCAHSCLDELNSARSSRPPPPTVSKSSPALLWRLLGRSDMLLSSSYQRTRPNVQLGGLLCGCECDTKGAVVSKGCWNISQRIRRKEPMVKKHRALRWVTLSIFMQRVL